ncbi:peptidase inhibitor family I36 protein [Streptomyces sp. NPDC101132]|uniref:peptidase inhibitor family I36 protein n=1 Tax=Streptomyces sp. NPDC101132 TaxID=3366110 RepID=UPI0038176B5E
MFTNLRRTAVGAVAAATLAVTALAASPSASAAEWDCPTYRVCVWNNSSFSGSPTWSSEGSMYGLWSGNGMSIKNNGRYHHGLDHVYWTGHNRYGTISGCLHFPPDKSATTIGGTFWLDSVTWGPECPS